MTRNSDDKYSRYLDYLEGAFSRAQLDRSGGGIIPETSQVAYSTGISLFDCLTGYKGLPGGRITEIFGATDAGKSSFALQLISAVQGLGGNAVYFDVEGKFDPGYAKNLGVDLKRCQICDSCVAEEVFDICELILRGGGVEILVIDSVTALLTAAEFGADGVSSSQEYYRIIGRGLRRLGNAIKSSLTALVFVSQQRAAAAGINVFAAKSTAERELVLRAALRMEFYRLSERFDNANAAGVELGVRIHKNGQQINRCADFSLLLNYDSGFDVWETIFINLLRCGVISAQNEEYYYNDILLGVGTDESVRFLGKNAAVTDAAVNDMLRLYQH